MKILEQNSLQNDARNLEIKDTLLENLYQLVKADGRDVKFTKQKIFDLCPNEKIRDVQCALNDLISENKVVYNSDRDEYIFSDDVYQKWHGSGSTPKNANIENASHLTEKSIGSDFLRDLLLKKMRSSDQSEGRHDRFHLNETLCVLWILSLAAVTLSLVYYFLRAKFMAFFETFAKISFNILAAVVVLVLVALAAIAIVLWLVVKSKKNQRNRS